MAGGGGPACPPLCARDEVTPFEALFSESTARALVAVPRSAEIGLTDACGARGVPFLRIGATTDAEATGEPAAVVVDGLFTLPLDEARAAHEGTLPRVFG